MMEELLKDKFLWTSAKFIEKEPIEEKTEVVPSKHDLSKHDNLVAKEDETKPEEEAEQERPEEVEAFGAIENKVIGLYFAASWCVPCQEFTSLLRETYDEIRERSSQFQIVYVSFDKKVEDMKEFFLESHGDWLAVPYKDPLIDSLKTMFKITAIPKLIIVRDDGSIITEKGRKDIQDKGIICFRGWLQKANLSSSKPSDTNKENEQTKSEKEKLTVTFKEDT